MDKWWRWKVRGRMYAQETNSRRLLEKERTRLEKGRRQWGMSSLTQVRGLKWRQR